MIFDSIFPHLPPPSLAFAQLLGVLSLSWRSLAVAAALPALFCSLFTWALVPESAPFLLVHGRYSEAKAALRSLGAGHKDWDRAREGAAALDILIPPTLIDTNSITTLPGDGASASAGAGAGAGAGVSADGAGSVVSSAHVPPRDGGVRLAFATTRSSSSLSSSASSSSSSSCCPSLFSALSDTASALTAFTATARPLYRTPFFTRTLALQAVWAGLSLASYGLALWLPQLLKGAGFGKDRYAGAFLFTLAQAPGCALGTWGIDAPWGGKRRLLVGGAAATAAVGALFALAGGGAVEDDGDDGQGGGGGGVWGGKGVALALICLYQIFTSVVWNTLDVLATVAFPASARSTAFALQAAAGRAGAIMGQFAFSYLVGVAPGAALWLCSGMMGAVALVGVGMGSYADVEGDGEGEEGEEDEAGTASAGEGGGKSEERAVVGGGLRSDASMQNAASHGGMELSDLEMQDDGL